MLTLGGICAGLLDIKGLLSGWSLEPSIIGCITVVSRNNKTGIEAVWCNARETL